VKQVTSDSSERMSSEAIWQLRRLTTPTVYNGWEQITAHNAARDGFNLEDARDFMPEFGPMMGRAVTAVVRVGGPAPADNRARWGRFREYVAAQPGPLIVVVQDLDKPAVFGSMWGEIGANTFRSLGCVGTITDGAVRDIDEMRAAGFKAIARRAAVGHGAPDLVGFSEAVEVFGRRVVPGRLIHADQHGFLVIPPEDESKLLRAATLTDSAEAGLLRAARDVGGKSSAGFLSGFDQAIDAFLDQVKSDLPKRGER